MDLKLQVVFFVLFLLRCCFQQQDEEDCRQCQMQRICFIGANLTMLKGCGIIMTLFRIWFLLLPQYSIKLPDSEGKNFPKYGIQVQSQQYLEQQQHIMMIMMETVNIPMKSPKTKNDLLSSLAKISSNC
jgi:hypothetical protein